jgi:two-component system sensor histidine kinase GlrK
MAIMVMVLFLAAYVVIQLRHINRLSHDIVTIDSATIRQITTLRETIYSQVGFERKFLISKDQDFAKKFWELNLLAKDQLLGVRLLADTAPKRKFIDQASLSHDGYEMLFKKEMEMLDKKEDYDRTDYKARKSRLIGDMDKVLKKVMKQARTDRETKIGNSRQISQHLLKVTVITAGLALCIGFLLSFMVTKSINRSILLLKAKTREIAKGRFEKILNISSPPEIKELADDFNHMSDRLRELDDMKIDFIGHVSHELRTPLTAIKEATSMLLEGVYADQPQKQTDLLVITKEECQRLILSVNKILDLSRMEAHMMEYAFRKQPLAPVIQKNVLKMSPLARKKSIQIEIAPATELPPIKMDSDKVEQVVENLLSNAIKYTPAGGRVIIDTILQQEPRKMIRVSITDSGPGIAQESLDKIFDKFRRIENGRETVLGTGLGLAITKHIITAHGGSIWVESTPQEGSTFIFTLPAG